MLDKIGPQAQGFEKDAIETCPNVIIYVWKSSFYQAMTAWKTCSWILCTLNIYPLRNICRYYYLLNIETSLFFQMSWFSSMWLLFPKGSPSILSALCMDMPFSQWEVESILPSPSAWAGLSDLFDHQNDIGKDILKFWNWITRRLASSSQASWNAHSWIPELPCKKLDYPAGVTTWRDPESAWRGGKARLSPPTAVLTKEPDMWVR